MIDVVPDYTVYPLLKYHALGNKNIISSNRYLPDVLPDKVKFRNNEILSIDFKEKLLLGDQSLRHTYEHLILACGNDPDFGATPGLVYSLQDNLNPIFTLYEYEKCINKMANYSQLLIKQFSHDVEFKVNRKNDNFIKNGGGNIIFVNCNGDINEILYSFQLIVLLFDLIKLYRKDFVFSNSFNLYIPLKENEFIDNLNSSVLYEFFVNLLKERNIKVNWEYYLQNVDSNQVLIFDNEATKHKVEHNFCHIMPKLRVPSFLKYSSDFEYSKLEVDSSTLKIKNVENVHVLGDLFSSISSDGKYKDRFDTNIFHQAQVLANNLKVAQYKLDKKKLKRYESYGRIYFDFDLKKYDLIDTQKNSVEHLKKGFWNKFLFGHFYYRPENFYAQKLFLEKKFKIKII